MTMEVEHCQNGLDGHIDHVLRHDRRPQFRGGRRIGASVAAGCQKSEMNVNMKKMKKIGLLCDKLDGITV